MKSSTEFSRGQAGQPAAGGGWDQPMIERHVVEQLLDRAVQGPAEKK